MINKYSKVWARHFNFIYHFLFILILITGFAGCATSLQDSDAKNLAENVALQAAKPILQTFYADNVPVQLASLNAFSLVKVLPGPAFNPTFKQNSISYDVRIEQLEKDFDGTPTKELPDGKKLVKRIDSDGRGLPTLEIQPLKNNDKLNNRLLIKVRDTP
jgi:hypothetical protein